MRDWSRLPCDLLCNILKLLSTVDYIRFSAVCKSWRSAAAERRHLPAPELPLLLIPHPQNPHQQVNLLSLSPPKANYSVQLPVHDFANRTFIGSSCGWLITTTCRGEVLMLNPLTGIQIELSAITTFPDVQPVEEDTETVFYDPKLHCGIPGYGAMLWSLTELSKIYFRKAILIPACPATSSTLSGGFAVVAIIDNCRLAFVRKGDAKWTIVRQPQSPHYLYFKEIAYIGSIVYAFASNYGELFTLDISTSTIQQICPPMNDYFAQSYSLVEVDGHLMLVGRQVKQVSIQPWSDFITHRVNIYKLDRQNKSWVRVEKLGDYCLFVGLNQALCFSTRDFPELKPNSIYFTDNNEYTLIRYPEMRRDMGVYDLQEKTMGEYEGYDVSLTYPPPVWLLPNSIDGKVNR